MKFEKVSLEQYLKDIFDKKDMTDEEKKYITEVYNNIKLPKRATKFSAGYDIYSPIPFKLPPKSTVTFKTGIKVKLNDNCFLMVVPRSSLGFKYKLQLDNTVGIIDADYYNNAKNEGHIAIKMTNNSLNKTIEFNAGDAIAQGIILNYLTTEDDDASNTREGGIGSTNKQ